jgi:serine/threonine protein kinase/tetratricopeptide (TPR) repeat protein
MSQGDADRNLLFGALAMQLELVDARRFADACAVWALHRNTPLGEVLVERGWLAHDDRAEVERLLDRKLKKHGGDAHASLMAVADADVRGALAGIDDPEVRRSIGDTALAGGHVLLSTVDHTPEARERYTLTRLHAKGGIGQVWLARDQDFGREVALKELRTEQASNPAVWARFLEEAKITGQLEHPGIVPVYEMARRPEGQTPFYTMRFVRGRTLTEAVRDYHRRLGEGKDTPLDLADLLNAFVGVCNAVAYAHSRGVIHRDLKGQNVVLGDFGEVIVLDWGLAKLVDRPEGTLTPAVSVEHTEDRSETLQGQVLGTPGYMAPEQAEGDLGRIDRRTDVYGLGAILYEILTGRPPFTGDTTVEVLRKVVADPIDRPRSINPSASAALEAVCIKALEKKPELRYASARELADEVRHSLADEPVSAYREPLPVRLSRWGRRHRPLVAVAVVLLVAAVLGLTSGTILLGRANARTEAERRTAEENFQLARRAVDQYFTTVSESKLLDIPGLQPLRKQLLDAARDYYQGFLRRRGDDQSVRVELAASHYRLAMITTILGPREKALDDFHQAVAFYERLVREGPAVEKYRTDLAICLNDFGRLLAALGEPDKALAVHRRAQALREVLAQLHPEVPRYLDELTRSYSNVGSLLDARGKTDEALDLSAKSLAIGERLVGSDPTKFEFPTDLGRRYSTLEGLQASLAGKYESTGALLAKVGRGDEGLADLIKARDIYARLMAKDPANFEYRSWTASSLLTLGYWQSRLGRAAEAQAGYDRALEIVSKLAADNPQVTDFTAQLAATYQYLGRLQREQGHLDEAVAMYERAREIQESLVRDHPDLAGLHTALAYTYRGIGRVRGQQGNRPDALSALERARAIDAKLAGTYPVAYYDMACDLALRVEFLDPSERLKAADDAMETLRRAVASGYKNLAIISTDPDLKVLSERSDFKELIARLEPSRKSPSP